MTFAFGIDIGGSSVKLGLVGPKGLVAGYLPIPLDRSQSFAAFATTIGDAVADHLARHDAPIAAIGIASPGFADRQTGILAEGGRNVPPSQGGSLPVALSDRFGVPCRLENDGVCAANGELRFGGWTGFANYAVATVGTGVGGAVIINGRIVLGRNGSPPEFGAISLDSRPSDDIVPGRLDRLGSATALTRRYRELAGDEPRLSARAIVDLARDGDGHAIRALDETMRWLAQAFGIMVNILNLDAIVVGGGLADAGPLVLDRITHHMNNFVWPSAFRKPQIVAARNGNHAGLVGAAAFALEHALAVAP